MNVYNFDMWKIGNAWTVYNFCKFANKRSSKIEMMAEVGEAIKYLT